LGEGDPHDERYDHLEFAADVNDYLQNRAGTRTRSYTAVPLNNEFGKYRLRIYPSQDTEDKFSTNNPWIYTVAVFLAFLLTAVVLLVLDRIVARRQRILMDRMVKVAQEKVAYEQQLNTFLAHEVRKCV
jgi:hypothetical protein